MFWKTFHLILIHFYFLYSMLWGMFFKNSVKKKKKGAFPDFWLIHCVFRSIEILVKNFSEPLSGSIDRTCFSINRTSWIWFFKHGSWLFQKSFFKSFFKFSLSLSLSLSDLDLAPPQIFIVFNPFFCKVSLSKHR